MLVSITITGILTTMVSLIYINYHDYFNRFISRNQNSVEILEFYSVCFKDFFESATIKANPENITFGTDTNTISYIINDNNIVRCFRSECDTFEITVNDIKIHTLAEDPELTYKVSFYTLLNGDELELIYSKEYESAVLFNHQIENGN